MQLPASSIVGIKKTPGTIVVDGLPAGCVIPFAGASAPGPAILVCNGQEISRADYSELFDAIGTTYGAGDGSTTFLVPDLRDRAVYGAGSQVAIAQTDGGALGTRGPKHSHDAVSAGDHQHSLSGTSGNGGGHSHTYTQPYTVSINIQNANDTPANTVGVQSASTSPVGDHTHGIQGVAATAGAHTHTISGGGVKDTPGFMGMLYVIVTGK